MMTVTQKISIVILCYNGYGYTHQLLMDIKQHCKGVHEVLVIDNASEDDHVVEGLNFWLGLKVLPLRVISLKHNRGFIGGMNYGIKKAVGDVVLVFSNDVRIQSPEFLEEVSLQFETDKKILLGSSLYTHDTGWNKFGIKIFPYMEGYFLGATKKAWQEWDGFDERYSPSDYEDVDLSTRAIKEGYKLVKLPDGMIKHLGGRTYGYNDERLARTKANRILFAHKWGVDCE